jgi:putative transposase
MPRQPRFRVPGFPQHIIHRGNDRKVTFHTDHDFRVYRRYLADAVSKHCCAVHSYCLMSNHVHLLVTPERADAIPKALQVVSQRYAQYFNRLYDRCGTLWEGRYRATLVDSDAYVLTCHRYIELNPVRAAMVADPAQYEYSSFRRNALGRFDPLISEHSVYQGLSDAEDERRARYRKMFDEDLGQEQLAEIRRATNSGLILGGDCVNPEPAQTARAVFSGPSGDK